MKLSQILFHSFLRIAGGTARLPELSAVTLTGILGTGQGLHFDGVLETHAGKMGSRIATPPTSTVLTEVVRLSGKTIVLTLDEPERFVSELMGNP